MRRVSVTARSAEGAEAISQSSTAGVRLLRFARNDEIRHSIRIFAAFATAPHFSRSVFRKAAKSAGEPILGSTASLASTARTSGDARLSFAAALSRAMISAGTPAGAASPGNDTDTE